MYEDFAGNELPIPHDADWCVSPELGRTVGLHLVVDVGGFGLRTTRQVFKNGETVASPDGMGHRLEGGGVGLLQKYQFIGEELDEWMLGQMGASARMLEAARKKRAEMLGR